MATRRTDWKLQICRIQDKGYQAFLDGKAESDCPYLAGYRNQNGCGGGLQRQRRQAWRRGWQEAKREQQEKSPERKER